MKIGDTAWHAEHNSIEKQRTCPDCFGKKKLTVILGDDSRVEIDCTGCVRGYDPPRGYVTYHEYSPAVHPVVIDRVEESSDGITYGFNGCYRTKELFLARDVAEARAKTLAEEYNEGELKRFQKKEKDSHTWAWHVTYHRRCIKQAEKDLEYHSAKLGIAQKKAKEDKWPNNS
jgi:hypothetical protein